MQTQRVFIRVHSCALPLQADGIAQRHMERNMSKWTKLVLELEMLTQAN